MVGRTAPSATTATTVRLGQHQRKSILPPRAQRVQQEEHQEEQETQLAAIVLLENFKRRTQMMKIFAQIVESDSTPIIPTRQSAKRVIQESTKMQKEKQLVSHAFL